MSVRNIFHDTSGNSGKGVLYYWALLHVVMEEDLTFQVWGPDLCYNEFVFTMSADGLAPKSARSSASTVMTARLDRTGQIFYKDIILGLDLIKWHYLEWPTYLRRYPGSSWV